MRTVVPKQLRAWLEALLVLGRSAGCRLAYTFSLAWLVSHSRRWRSQVKQDLLSTPLSYKDVTQWLLQVDINREALREMQEETLGSQLGHCEVCCSQSSEGLSAFLSVASLDYPL